MDDASGLGNASGMDDASGSFPDTFDEDGAPASVDALRGVLSRHRRTQFRVLATMGVAVLAVSAAAGYLIGNNSGPGSSVQAASGGSNASTPSAALAPSASSAAVSAGAPVPPATQLLVRTATDGVQVRLYERVFPSPQAVCKVSVAPATPGETPPSPPPTPVCPSPPPACFPTSLLTAEVNDAQDAAQTMAPEWSAPSTATAFQPLSAMVTNQGEPQPMLVVIVKTTSAVSTVKLTTSYGTDTETPTPAGWSALAVQLPANYTNSASDGPLPAGTVSGLSSSGATVGSSSLSDIHAGPPTKCMPTPPPGCKETVTSGAAGAAPATSPACPVCQMHISSSSSSGTGSSSSSGTGSFSSSGTVSSSSSGTVSSSGSGTASAPPTVRSGAVPPGAAGGGGPAIMCEAGTEGP